MRNRINVGDKVEVDSIVCSLHGRQGTVVSTHWLWIDVDLGSVGYPYVVTFGRKELKVVS